MDSFDSRNLRRILKMWQDKVMYFKRKREDRPVPSQHHTSETSSDLVQKSDPHESGEATKAGHELEAARQKRTWQTADDLEATISHDLSDLDMTSEEAEAAALDRTKWRKKLFALCAIRHKKI